MPKKIEEAEVKKECPSCGLGVSLESKICEFCGWNFDEEDEWILQIEKLERNLELEKQKFEPGTVDEKIESSLHSPVAVMQETSKSSTKTAAELGPEPMSAAAPEREAEPPTPEHAIQVPARLSPAPARPAVSKPPEPRPKKVPSSKARLVRVVKSEHPEEEIPEGATTKRRLVRKVKEHG